MNDKFAWLYVYIVHSQLTSALWRLDLKTMAASGMRLFVGRCKVGKVYVFVTKLYVDDVIVFFFFL